MRKITSMLNAGAAGRLRQLLQEAGIPSEMTVETTNAYLGSSGIAVWVDEEADAEQVQEILQDFQQAVEVPPTRVDLKGSKKARCDLCKYSLRGQIADGLCPECGHPYFLVTVFRCPKCEAENPSDFDICWQCEAELHPE